MTRAGFWPMNRRPLRTTELSQAVGVHPNTVRLYEEWGFLPPIPRSPSGYRLFSKAHLDQMRLARTALGCAWAGRSIRRSALTLVRQAAAGDLSGALEQAHRHLALVREEQAQANAAAESLERWAQDAPVDELACPLTIGQTAERLHVTTDMLRNWERNGLLSVPRDPQNGYRRYGAAEIERLRLIRLLLRAGYGMMAILRMLLQFDSGQREGLREALDTPLPDEDICYATNRWLSTLAEQEERAADIIVQLAEMIRKQNCEP